MLRSARPLVSWQLYFLKSFTLTRFFKLTTSYFCYLVFKGTYVFVVNCPHYWLQCLYCTPFVITWQEQKVLKLG